MLALLPTPNATLLCTAHGNTELYGPHGVVWILPAPRIVLDVPSDLVKVLFGPVTDFVDRMFGESEHPFLDIFRESPKAESWQALLKEAEDSVTITDDQMQFRRWIANPGSTDRQAERLCQRYAGQSPTRIRQQVRVSAEFAANLDKVTYTPQGFFADQSHYIRVCRELTGHTPTELKNVSDSFYLNGDVLDKLS
jgi:hypothetical protein